MTQAAADAEGQYPRKRLADCLAVPATTGVVCPQDLTALPRPASCPAGGACQTFFAVFRGLRWRSTLFELEDSS